MSTGNDQGHNFHPAYRPDIDGLRAVAILAVIFYHALPESVRGGFVGVDVFFVISGFLISSIIFRSLNKGDFSFPEFYARRIKRIFPALLVVLLAMFGIGWVVLLPDEFEQLGKHIAAGAGFVQNFVLLDEAGYFDKASALKPLMHLWSLAIEEQFYLIYPLLIWTAWRLRINIFGVVAVLALVSFGLNIAESGKDAVQAFFSPQTRFWELLVGALLAYLQLHKTTPLDHFRGSRIFHPVISRFRELVQTARHRAFLGDLLSVLGLILIVVSVLVIHQKHFPGWRALLPVMGAAFLILAGADAWANRKILASRPMVFIGVISYPLYLWHWPLLSLARIIRNGEPPLGIRLGMLAASILLAWLTYRVVERPIRFGRQTWVKPVALASVIFMVGGVGFYTHVQDGFEFRVEAAAELSKVSKAAGEWGYPGNLTPAELNGIAYYQRQSQRTETTLFIGDSNMQHYYPRMDELIETSPGTTNSVIFETEGGCFPVPGTRHEKAHKQCDHLMSDALTLVKNMPQIETVVISAQWSTYLVDGGRLLDGVKYGNDAYKNALDRLAAYIKELVALGKNVYLVLNIPIGPQLDPKYIVQRNLADFPHVFQFRDGGVDRSAFDGTFNAIQADLARIASGAGAKVIKPFDFLCREKCASLDPAGEPIYKDPSHLRPFFVRKELTYMDVTVREPGTQTVN